MTSPTPFRRAPLGLLAGALMMTAPLGCGERGDAPGQATALDDTPSTASEAAGHRRGAEAEARKVDPPPAKVRTEYEERLVQGASGLYSGRYEDARTQYLRAMELRPEKMAPALGALRALVLRGRAEERAQISERIRRKIAAYHAEETTRGAGDLLNARLAIALGDPSEAIERAQLATRRMPNLGVAWRVLGEAESLAGRWRRAIRAYRKASDLGLVAKAGTWERLADARDELGDTQGAREAAERALALTGDDPHARRRRLNLLAVVLKHGGDLEAAAKIAEQARQLGPEDPPVLHNLASIAEAAGRLEDSERLYTEALRGGPYPMASWRLGHLYLKSERPERALSAFMEAASHLSRWAWPVSTRWWPAYDVGRLFATAGDYTRAAGWFSDALRQARTPEASREIRSWQAFAKVQSRGR